MATVLVLGSGGREHVLSWKLSQSSLVRQVYVAPGNAGTLNGIKTNNADLSVKDFPAIEKFCKEKSVSLVVVGPEDPLAEGISDHLNSKGIPCFGPSAKAARIEASKDFAKQFMCRHGIPTARFKSFTDLDAACQHIQTADYPALVVKASGLAAGKGVVVAKTKEEACKAASDIMKNKSFGSAGDIVVVEEFLEGEEVSCLAFSDGTTVAMMPPAQDHKQLCDGDTGPNTGGMGALCPYPLLSEGDLQMIKRDVLQKAVDGMKAEGYPYVGVLYAGLMLTKDGPKVLEFNCRFGDPETQSIIPLLRSDLYTVCKSCVEGTLCHNLPEFDHKNYMVGVVLVSGGYPGSYKKGVPISGLDGLEGQRLTVFHAGTAMKDGHLVTSGGRVLAVMAMNSDLKTACARAQSGAELIKFENSFNRKDIGFRVLQRLSGGGEPCLSYKDAGVNINAGNDLIKAISPVVKATSRPGCEVRLGGFGGVFDIKAAGYKDPILVSGTDGVGTKLKVAHYVGRHSTIGKDLVAMCVNDILAHGAEPLFFLDYFATGRLNVSMATDVIAGITEGCKEAGCALIGGETAEMPGMYRGEDYDLAGFTVGAVERGQMLPRLSDIKAGDVLIGLSSSGLHSNGYSLVRKVVEKLRLSYDVPSPFKSGRTLGEDLLEPTKIYIKSVLPLMKGNHVKAFCHVTGGGLMENLPRVLPGNMSAILDASKWTVPPVFGWLSQKGNISEKEMARTFNCGIGAVLVVDSSKSEMVKKQLNDAGEEASIVGSVHDKIGESAVTINNLQSALRQAWHQPSSVCRKKKVGVLISGSGTNLQALIDHTLDKNNNSSAQIVLVISNKPGVQGLTRAEKVGIKTMVINHKDYKSREEFDTALHTTLTNEGVDIVCLAGFMRILTGGFVRKWNGRMLNIHPSLLPSFKGHNAHEQVLQANVRISGCTVHFVAEEVDAGAVLVQESVPVYPGDTMDTLSERVKKVEHKAFPAALDLVASEQAVLQDSGTIRWQLQ